MSIQEIYNKSDNNIRLDVFLLSHLQNVSRTKIQKLIHQGFIRVDDFIVKPSYKLRGKENIHINYNESNFNNDEYLIKEDIPIDIIYEDSDLIAINKKPGMVVHPGAGNKSGTLLNALLFHFKKLSNLNSSRPGIVHRLDKNTSGIILVAKTEEAHYLLSEQFASRTIKKHYKAIVWGKALSEGNIEGYINRDKKNRIKYMLNSCDGKYSFTKYKRLDYSEPFSYLDLYPLTGRTHQLRVHLKEIGHPIIMDDLYGGSYNISNSFHQKHKLVIDKVFKKIDRFALHAYNIKFIHPILKKEMDLSAPLPDDFKNLMEILF